MKKMICLAMSLFCLTAATMVYAAEEQLTAPADAAATNFAAAYPAVKEKSLPVPAPPASLTDAKATAAYIAAVDAYLKAAQRSLSTRPPTTPIW